MRGMVRGGADCECRNEKAHRRVRPVQSAAVKVGDWALPGGATVKLPQILVRLSRSMVAGRIQIVKSSRPDGYAGVHGR